MSWKAPYLIFFVLVFLCDRRVDRDAGFWKYWTLWSDLRLWRLAIESAQGFALLVWRVDLLVWLELGGCRLLPDFFLFSKISKIFVLCLCHKLTSDPNSIIFRELKRSTEWNANSDTLLPQHHCSSDDEAGSSDAEMVDRGQDP